MEIVIPPNVLAVKNINIIIDKSLKSNVVATCDLHFCTYNATITDPLNHVVHGGAPPSDYVLDYNYQNKKIPNPDFESANDCYTMFDSILNDIKEKDVIVITEDTIRFCHMT